PPPLDAPPASHQPQRLLFDIRSHIGQLGRLPVAPPTLDDGQLTALRRAAQLALADPELLAQAAQLQRPINYLSGQRPRPWWRIFLAPQGSAAALWRL
ncbi:MAG: hypothetical protein ACFCBW_11390, partial [Candidatus Competibacterales bacterium]